jgi:iron(III) transport system substrate-binding protein
MGSSSYRDVLAGDYSFEIIWELQPSSGYAYRNALAMVGFNEHPNAAKLFLNWLMGSGDGTGFAPWNVPGNFPVRTDMATPEPFLPISEYNYWYDDQEHHDLTYDVMDFWMMHM